MGFMFKNIRIKGFRSCVDVELDDLRETTALIGRNASGKTNVLKAIEMLAQLAIAVGPTSPGWQSVPNFGRMLTPDEVRSLSVAFSTTIVLRNREYHYELMAIRYPRSGGPIASSPWLKESLSITEENRRSYVFTRDGEHARLELTGEELMIGAGVSSLFAFSAILPSNHPIQLLGKQLVNFFSSVRYFPLDEPSTLPSLISLVRKQYMDWKYTFESTGILGDNVPAQLTYLYDEQKEAFDDLTSSLGNNGLKLIRYIRVQRFGAWNVDESVGDSYIILFTPFDPDPSKDELTVGYEMLSQGTRRIVRLLTAMAFDHCSVMLVEHPEECVHTGLLRKLSGLFITGLGKAQIIFSTHSDVMMNDMEMEDIRFVGMEQGKTNIRALTPNEREAASDYVNSGVEGTFSEFLHFAED